MHAVTQQADGEDSRDDAFYVFTASASECFETLELCINDKIVNVIVDSGASCNLMSEHVFHSLTEGKEPLAECDKHAGFDTWLPALLATGLVISRIY